MEHVLDLIRQELYDDQSNILRNKHLILEHLQTLHALSKPSAGNKQDFIKLQQESETLAKELIEKRKLLYTLQQVIETLIINHG